MSLLDIAREDYRNILKDVNEWSVPIVFTSKNNVTANVVGHGMTHNITYGTDGQVVNGKNTHVTIVEKDLTDLGYPTRNTRGVVSMSEHTVSFIDTNGVNNFYLVSQYFPDETLGTIVCILTDKKTTL